ncbi:hypothetical protein [Streptomyces sp. 900105245]
MPREDKWRALALAAMIAGVVMVAAANAGSVVGEPIQAGHVLWVALMLVNIGIQCWDLYARRRKRRAERQALLPRLDHLMRREVKRRCR